MNAPDRITTVAHSPHSPKVDMSDSQSSSSAMIVESSKLIPLLVAVCIACAMMAGFAVAYSAQTERLRQINEREVYRLGNEFKQVQVQLMDANALFLREGLVKDGDQVYGPAGNLTYKQHELRKK